jgi:hypothetical protein
VTVIEKQPRNASLDEVVDALWAWGKATPEGAAVCGTAANRLLAVNPAEFVMANRAARDAAVLGMSRQIALDVVQGLPATASVDDILVSIATWRWHDATD